MAAQCIHFFVSGQVQGVFYRAFAQKNAQALNLTGWAKNLADGRVEILACGEDEALKQFHTLLKQGPEYAKVDHIEIELATFKAPNNFKIIY